MERRESRSDLFPAHFIPLILFLYLLPSMMMDSRKRAQIIHLEYFKAPRYIEGEKNQSRKKFRATNSLFTLGISLVDFRLTIVVNRRCFFSPVWEYFRARTANVRFPVLRSARCLVHMRILLHVVASLPRFSRCFDVVTNKCELPFLFQCW